MTCGCCCALAGLFLCSCKQCEKVAIVEETKGKVANKLFELQIQEKILKKMQQMVL